MCAWDATKPIASGYLQSSPVRNNFAAIEDQALGRNLLGDPDFLIWSAGTTACPAWWNKSGDADIYQYTASFKGTAGYGARLSYNTNLSKIWQNVLSTGDMSSSVKIAFNGLTVSAGARMYTGSADCRLVLHGPSSDVVSSAIPSGSWYWVTKSLTLASSTMTRLGMGMRTNAAGYSYMTKPTLVLGPIPPTNFIPAIPTRDTIVYQVSGDPVTTGEKFRYRHPLPFIIEYVTVQALTAPSSVVSVDVNNYYSSAFNSIFSSTTTQARLVNAATAGKVPSPADYRTQCFDAGFGTTVDNTLLTINVDAASTSGGKDPTVGINILTYQPPLQSWRAYNHYK